ncbi:MAG: Bro-N domain-containing protein, partial [Peptostreptococcaceae bacterium]|nr:Bro-N domain-containing protein [Peptostreptococcaceae bacterium]
MANEITTFENKKFGKLTVIEKDGEFFFIGKEVAGTLGYTNTQKAIRDHVEEEDKLTERIVHSGQKRNMYIINESGLYSLILSSKLPQVKEFKRWVTTVVLPSIRKHGGYIKNQEDLSSEEILANAV